MTAAEFVHSGLTACLPPGVPLSCTISSAQFISKQRAVAEVVMFDGAPGTVEVSQNPRFFNAWCIAWQNVGGWACFWNGSAWVRDTPTQLTIFDLPGGAA